MAISTVRLLPQLGVLLIWHHDGVIKADLLRWAEIWYLEKPKNLKEFMILFITFMTFTPEFRNLFYLRFGLKASIFAWTCPPLDTLEINANYIGPGLFIQHGISTLISAHSIGANCWINQQVTIGYSNQTDRPTIGDNVRVCAGAKIIGKVRIGNNATIGANTIVISDVAANTTVFGVPGKVIWRSRPAPVDAD